MGDLVVMPLKTTSQIAFGVVTEQCWYNADDDPSWRHVVSVEWKRTDVPRTAVKQDLLHSLGSALTICTITRNDGRHPPDMPAAVGIGDRALSQALRPVLLARGDGRTRLRG